MSQKSISDLFPDASPTDPVRRLRSAAVKIRSLRSQIGAEGLSPAGARSLLEELTAALEACAAGLERKDR